MIIEVDRNTRVLGICPLLSTVLIPAVRREAPLSLTAAHGCNVSKRQKVSFLPNLLFGTKSAEAIP
jgi:hypothetical protein